MSGWKDKKKCLVTNCKVFKIVVFLNFQQFSQNYTDISINIFFKRKLAIQKNFFVTSYVTFFLDLVCIFSDSGKFFQLVHYCLIILLNIIKVQETIIPIIFLIVKIFRKVNSSMNYFFSFFLFLQFFGVNFFTFKFRIFVFTLSFLTILKLRIESTWNALFIVIIFCE